MSTTIKRPVLRYHGGKFLLAKWIISQFPKHRVYVEPFGGAASVLMQKPRAYAEIYNDVWETVVNVFSVLRDPEKADELERVIRLTPYSRKEFETVDSKRMESITSSVERARLTILRSLAGFGSASTNEQYSTGFRANSNRSGSTPAHDWKNYPNHIQAFTKRLQGVIIENKNYVDVINQHDTVETLFYFDPPYKHKTRNMERGNAAYGYELNDNQHESFCKTLLLLKGSSVVSGYDNELYNDYLYGWNKSYKASYADGASKRTEVLWLSPGIHEQMVNKLQFQF